MNTRTVGHERIGVKGLGPFQMPYNPEPEFRLPILEQWMKQFLGVLFGMYVVELILRNSGYPVQILEWHAFDAGFAVYQPLTRFAVQGQGAVVSVIIGLVVLYFLIPGILQLYTRRQVLMATAWAALGGTALPMLFDAIWFQGGMVMGWPVLVITLVVLFGLALPDGTMNIWFVIPVSGTLILYGTLGLSIAFFILAPGMGSAESLGVWLGAYGWWHIRGPGGRRRHLKRKAAGIERELRKFEVIEGGRANEPRSQGRQGDRDDWIH